MRKYKYRSRSRSNHKHKKYFINYAGTVIQDHRQAGIEKGSIGIVLVLLADHIHLLLGLPLPHPPAQVQAAHLPQIQLEEDIKLLTSDIKKEKDLIIDIESKDF